jgi:hypothetical protein
MPGRRAAVASVSGTTLIREAFAGAAIIAITILTIVYFYQLVGL